LDGPNVLVTTIKRAEDGHGVVVRLIETDGKETAITLNLPHLSIEKAWQTNLVEEDRAELTCTEHSVTAPIKAFGITTLRVETH
jgi:alpha-mannosidase